MKSFKKLLSLWTFIFSVLGLSRVSSAGTLKESYNSLDGLNSTDSFDYDTNAAIRELADKNLLNVTSDGVSSPRTGNCDAAK